MWNIDTNSPLQSVLDNSKCPPLLRRALTGPISWQTRNETPVRKSLTMPHWAATLLALGATVSVEGDAGTEEEIPLPVKVGAPRPHTLHIPPSGPNQRWGEARVARTPADEPIVSAVAVVELDGDTVSQARVALTGVWSEPARLAQAAAQLVGRPLDEANIQAVAEEIEKEVAPGGDFRGSKEYRRAMSGLLARRALEQCLQQEASDE